LQKSLEASLQPEAHEDPAQIVECQKALAAKIVQARRDAFRRHLHARSTERFRKIIRKSFEARGHLARKTMQQDTPFRLSLCM